MEASVRAPAKCHPLLAAMAATALAISSSSWSTPVVVEAFATPAKTRAAPTACTSTRSSSSYSSSSSSRLGVSIGLGPESDGSSATKWSDTTPGGEGDDDVQSESSKKFGKEFDPYDPDIVIRGEDGLPLPHITDFEPYREKRMSISDRAADAWFASLLESPGV